MDPSEEGLCIYCLSSFKGEKGLHIHLNRCRNKALFDDLASPLSINVESKPLPVKKSIKKTKKKKEDEISEGKIVLQLSNYWTICS